MKAKTIAVVGGGINGVMTAWALLDLGFKVCLFEAGKLMGATSSASSKMLHGGLRYLEQGRLGLVREALLERRWWLNQKSGLAEPFEIIIPGYRGKGRPLWLIRMGTLLYDILAIGSNLQSSRYLDYEETLQAIPGLLKEGLVGSVSYWDVRMDDEHLGLWAVAQLKNRGLEVHENSRVDSVRDDGVMVVNGHREQFDAIANVTGPWALRLLEASNLHCPYQLIAVRGSHLVVNRNLRQGCLFQQNDGRVVFYLPFRGRALLGTTEAKADPSDDVAASSAEIEELISIHAKYVTPAIEPSEILEVQAGLRPIVLPKFNKNANTKAMSRESLTVRNGKIITLLGGKWTTSRRQGQTVAKLIDMMF